MPLLAWLLALLFTSSDSGLTPLGSWMKQSTEPGLDSAYDLVVIGGGVVGCAILRAATLAGYRCALVEQEKDLLSWASGSNSGIACTGVDAAPGTLERALIRDSIAQLRLFCAELGLPTRPCGSLCCHWPWDKEDRLSEVLAESIDAGDTHASRLVPDEVLAMEPNLARTCLGAVHIPGEVVVDPWLYSIALAVHARENGADIFTDWPMDPRQSSLDDGVWTIRRRGDTETGLKSRAVVCAAGTWSDDVQEHALGEAAPWEARPRRGQYRIYQSSDSTLLTHPIQPVPSQRTKGIFIFSTLYDQIVVGPTALDQESKTDRSTDPAVAEELAACVKRVLPAIDTQADYIGDYVGIRPGTDKRDYQIHLNFPKRWVSCAGIRSTGLTASLGIGRHVLHLLQQGLLPEPTLKEVRTTPMPSVEELVDDFHRRGDGCVVIQGHTYRVTHPLTVHGWKARTGLASSNN